jgi:major vault protein
MQALSKQCRFELLASAAAHISRPILQRFFFCRVRDHIGDACKAIASRIRAAAAAETFDRFHKMSAKLIRIAVFGVDEHGKVGDQFIFNANNLAITNIDIQSVEPVDERTHESLQKSVQLAIEIATKKQERNARHSAEVIEQTARGKIEEQRLKTQADIETCRQSLTHLLAKSAAVSSTGTATAEAHAKAEYLEIQAQADLKVAEMTAQAMTIAATASLTDMKKTQQLEIDHERNMDELDISKNQALADIEAKKFRDIVAAITPKALQEIARAGPEFQVRLLKGLGLKGYLMTDGSAPINLFSAAKGMTAPNMQSMAAASGAAGASSS